jgi:hypothetical protein
MSAFIVLGLFGGPVLALDESPAVSVRPMSTEEMRMAVGGKKVKGCVHGLPMCHAPGPAPLNECTVKKVNGVNVCEGQLIAVTQLPDFESECMEIGGVDDCYEADFFCAVWREYDCLLDPGIFPMFDGCKKDLITPFRIKSSGTRKRARGTSCR